MPSGRGISDGGTDWGAGGEKAGGDMEGERRGGGDFLVDEGEGRGGDGDKASPRLNAVNIERVTKMKHTQGILKAVSSVYMCFRKLIM